MEKLVHEIYRHLKENYSIEDLHRAGIVTPYTGRWSRGKEAYEMMLKRDEDLHMAYLAVGLAFAGREYDKNQILIALDRLLEDPAKYPRTIKALRRLHYSVGLNAVKQALEQTKSLSEATIKIAAKNSVEREKELLSKPYVVRALSRVKKYIEEF